MIKIYFLSLLMIFSLFLGVDTEAQIGGRYAYSFLEKPISARVASLGGNTAVIRDGDINLALVNPSLINKDMNNAISLAYVDFYSDINYGFAQYGRTFKKAGSFVGTVQYYNYGSFDYADVAGNTEGTFSASDAAITIGWGRELDSSFSIGAAAKLIYSHYEAYTSFGFAVDVAGSYRAKSGWEMSLIARNIGMQMTTYVSGVNSPLPFDLQFVISKRLDHVPFRFSLIYDHIEKWSLYYDDPTNASGGVDPVTGDPIYKTGVAKFSDNLMRHFIFGGEFYVGKNLILRAGYNYRRRQELKMNDKLGMVGFSWGIGIRVYKFKINYARSTYHLVGSPNYFSISFNLDSFVKSES